ncbi:Ankyrin repeat and KH domain-containing protein 1 [Taenia crassiceps]|uniref:Ankyrin repeat and KH domain-containing protein 1 n=1 Tax=Taenia crassiceps TaxID=6207 RepID=A0ABR4QHL2_9CEST
MTDSHDETIGLDGGEADTDPLTLSQTVRANNVTRVKQLLQGGANPEVCDADDTTIPLIEATLWGFAKVVEALLLHGALPSHTDVINNTALHWAIAACHWNCLMLLLNHGSPLETANYKFCTPLMQAAFYGHIEIVQCLIDRGANVDQPLNSNKDSALTLACEMGDNEIIGILLKVGESNQGAEVNRYEDSVDAPILAAICGGNLDIVKLLIAYHANIEERNKVGYTPLMLAAQKGAGDMVTELLDVGACIDAAANDGHETALPIARAYNRKGVKEVLLTALAQRNNP